MTQLLDKKPTEFNPMAVRRPFIPTALPLAPSDEPILEGKPNGGPALDPPTPFELITQEINDLFDEAKNFADGEPIDSEPAHDAITKLYDGLHDAGKRADALRKEEKDPHDDAVKEIQARYNPFIQDKRGKVAMGKTALGELLAAWRKKKADAAAAEAARIRKVAEEAEAAARAAMQSSAGNLEARVGAEQHVEQAKAWSKAANRADKAATVGTGLRTVWRGTVEDWGKVLDWAYAKDEARFRSLCQDMVDEAVRSQVRTIPGVRVWDDKVAA